MRSILEIQKALKDNPFNISVVGHSNHGKTSILRTLSGKREFGETADEANVTGKPDEVPMKLNDVVDVVLWKYHDTPGFEMAHQAVDNLGRNLEFDELVNFLEGKKEYETGFQAICHVKEVANLLLYVIDVGTDPTEMFADELLLLGKSGKPIIPIFNLRTGGKDRVGIWKKFLNEQKLYRSIKFDAHDNTIDDKITLFRVAKEVTAVKLHQELIDWQLKEWSQQKLNQVSKASEAIASLVHTVSLYRPFEESSKGKQAQIEAKKELIERFHRKLQRLELKTMVAIAKAFDVDESYIKHESADIDCADEWKRDSQVRPIGGGAATGAGLGAAVDVMTGGILLGVPTLVGTALGAAGVFTAKNYLVSQDKHKGRIYITAEAETICEMVSRCLFVWMEVEKLGTAATGRDRNQKQPHKTVKLEDYAKSAISKVESVKEIVSMKVAELRKKGRPIDSLETAGNTLTDEKRIEICEKLLKVKNGLQ